MAPCDAHCISTVMWNKATNSVAEYWEHTQGVDVPQSHTYLHAVFLCDRGDIEQSAIFTHYDKHAYLCFKGGIVGWNCIPAEAVAKDEVDILIYS